MSFKIEYHKIGGCDLELEIGDNVFRPTSTSRFLIDNVEIKEGAKVLDLGCGVGPLAIIAAKRGAAKVYAVDIMEEACAYAQRNAVRNQVSDRMVVFQGDLFEPVKEEKFDVIIDDVSGMAEEPSRLSGWYPESIPTGGLDGTEPTIRMLTQARRYLKKDGALYFPVLSLADSKKIIDHARDLFGDRLEEIMNKMIPFCDELKTRIRTLEKLKDAGIINYVVKHTRYLWNLRVFKAHALASCSDLAARA